MDDKEYKALVKSYGGKAVGLDFNPSGLIAVQKIKHDYAEIINELDASRNDAKQALAAASQQDSGDISERLRLLSVAITETQAACMWAVKALVWTV